MRMSARSLASRLDSGSSNSSTEGWNNSGSVTAGYRHGDPLAHKREMLEVAHVEQVVTPQGVRRLR
jgi:hypothetical protein